MPLPDLFAVLALIAGDLLPAFLSIAAPVLVFGVPAIMLAATLPARLGVQPVKKAELTDAQRRWLSEIDGLLLPQGYAPALTFTAVQVGNRNLGRAYLSSGDPAVAMAGSVVSKAEEGSPLASTWFELETRYEDGTEVGTSNSADTGRFAAPPHVERRKLPHLRNPLAVKGAHDKACEPHRARTARYFRAEELVELIETDHVRQMDYQVKAGCYVRKQDGGYRLSFLQAVRHVVGYLNPFEQRQLWRRLASAVLVTGLPLLSAAAGTLGAPIVATQLSLADPRVAMFGAMLLPVLLGAVALGAVLEAKAPIWAFFLPLVAVRMLPDLELAGFEHAVPLVLGVVSAQLALWTTGVINGRRGML